MKNTTLFEATIAILRENFATSLTNALSVLDHGAVAHEIFLAQITSLETILKILKNAHLSKEEDIELRQLILECITIFDEDTELKPDELLALDHPTTDSYNFLDVNTQINFRNIQLLRDHLITFLNDLTARVEENQKQNTQPAIH